MAGSEACARLTIARRERREDEAREGVVDMSSCRCTWSEMAESEANASPHLTKGRKNTCTEVEVRVGQCHIVGKKDAGRTAERGERLCQDLVMARQL